MQKGEALIFIFGAFVLGILVSKGTLPTSGSGEDISKATFTKAMDSYFADYLRELKQSVGGYEKLQAAVRSPNASIGESDSSRADSEDVAAHYDPSDPDHVTLKKLGYEIPDDGGDDDFSFEQPLELPIGDSPVRGAENGLITLIYFADFECPFSADGALIIDQLMDEYPENLRVVFKHLPAIGCTVNSEEASRAAVAAEKQGKFWEMHDLLFANYDELSEKKYLEIAERIGLDIEAFNKERGEAEVDRVIDRDVRLAKKYDLYDTPTFFINGYAVKGVAPIEEFTTIIDREIEKSMNGFMSGTP